MSRWFSSLGVFLCVLAVFGCTKKEAQQAPAKELNLAIWGNYLSDDMIKKFTESTGIKLNVSNYASNEELLAKIQSGSSGYDVIVPSDYMVEVMAKLGLLQELDLSKIPNSSLVSADFMNQPFDPNNKYSLPYGWVVAGIAVNTELYKGKIQSWKDLLESKELKGKLSLLDDSREVTAAALKRFGYSVNSTKSDELAKAKELLKTTKSRVKMFQTDTLDPLLNKEVAAAQVYSSDGLQAEKQSSGKIKFIMPDEGGTKTIDNLAILKSSKRSAEALQLVNFLLSEDANVSFVKNVLAGPVLKTTKAKLPQDLQTLAGLFPTSQTLSKFERLQDLGDSTEMYDKLWSEIKTE